MYKLIVSLSFIILFACSSEKDAGGPKAVIEARITGMPEGEPLVRLKKMGFSGPVVVDSCTAQGGEFRMEVPADDENLYRIEVGNTFLPVFLEAGIHRLEADYSRMYASARYSNSPLTEQIRSTESLRLGFEERASGLKEQYEASMYYGNISAADSCMRAFENLRLEYKFRVKSFIDSLGPGPVSYLATSMLSTEEDFSYLDSLTTRFEKEKPGKAFTKKMISFMELPRKLAPGKPAPDFQLPDPAGNVLSLSKFRGNWVLLDFWASWCKPCRAENPFLVALASRYGKKGLKLLSVSLDGDRKAWMKAMVQDQMNWAHCSDLKGWQNAAARSYGVQSIPASFLIDPEGLIVAKNLRGKFLEEKLAEVLP